jgi:hypothetical protein
MKATAFLTMATASSLFAPSPAIAEEPAKTSMAAMTGVSGFFNQLFILHLRAAHAAVWPQISQLTQKGEASVKSAYPEGNPKTPTCEPPATRRANAPVGVRRISPGSAREHQSIALNLLILFINKRQLQSG